MVHLHHIGRYVLNAALFVLVTASPISCNRSILDIPPPAQDEQDYFTSETEFLAAIIGTYAKLTDFYSSTGQQGYGSAQLEIWFLPGDDLTQNGSQSFEFFKGLNPAEPKLNQFFRSSYTLIGRANKVLDKLEHASDNVFVTPGLRQYNRGEMLFLRAFAHFMLWNVFGTAPVDTIVVKSVNDPALPSSRNTELLDQAISDLEKAAALLPQNGWDQFNTGRATANAANGLLGKCLVFRACATGNMQDYIAAIEAFDRLRNVSLVPAFSDNFDISAENNAESLFEFQAGQNITGSQNTWLANDDCDCGVTGSYYQMFYEGAASYMSNGPYMPTAKLREIFSPGDPRQPFTIVNNDITKYVWNGDRGNNHLSFNNHRILRYADIVLLRAEALLKGSGNSSEAVSLINAIRRRARKMVPGGMVPEDLDTSVGNESVVMRWIMDERLRELAAEGHRWFDLRRWHLAGYINLNNEFFGSAVPARMGFDEHYLYFPIPENETSKNPNIIQNTGY